MRLRSRRNGLGRCFVFVQLRSPSTNYLLPAAIFPSREHGRGARARVRCSIATQQHKRASELCARARALAKLSRPSELTVWAAAMHQRASSPRPLCTSYSYYFRERIPLLWFRAQCTFVLFAFRADANRLPRPGCGGIALRSFSTSERASALVNPSIHPPRHPSIHPIQPSHEPHPSFVQYFSFLYL